jgi:hypothetical protein
MFREDRFASISKKKRKERADPVKSHKPELGPIAATQKGLQYPGMQTSRSFAQHLFKEAVGPSGMDYLNQDPREALLKYVFLVFVRFLCLFLFINLSIIGFCLNQDPREALLKYVFLVLCGFSCLFLFINLSRHRLLSQSGPQGGVAQVCIPCLCAFFCLFQHGHAEDMVKKRAISH